MMPTDEEVKEDLGRKKAVIAALRDGFFQKLAQLQNDSVLGEDASEDHE